MKTRWIALLIPAALALGFAQYADAGGYGNKHGHYGHSQSHGYSYGGYRKHGYAPGYRHSNRGHYRPAYPAVHRGFRLAHPAYRHGHHMRRSHHYFRGHPHYRPHYRGGVTLHFGY